MTATKQARITETGEIVRIEFGIAYTLILHPQERAIVSDFILSEKESATIKTETGDTFTLIWNHGTDDLTFDGGIAGKYRVTDVMNLVY